MVRADDGLPKYQRIAMILRARIAQGEIAPGRHFNPILRLAAEFGVESGTIKRALNVLRGEGLIIMSRGKQAQVVGHDPLQGVRLGSKVRVTARMPTFEERVEHDLDPGVPFLVVDGTPYPANRFHLYTD